MGSIIILALLDVLVIKQIYSIFLKTMSLKVLNKEDLPFWGLEKFIQKLIDGIICGFSKSWERLIPHGNVCYKTLLNGHLTNGI
jgi:hypothetical protein